MGSRICPLCGKELSDLLKHLRFSHDITDPNELENEISKNTKLEEDKIVFAAYVEDLQQKKKIGEISDEKYRELITQWVDQHRR